MLLYLTFATTKVEIKLLPHFFRNSFGCLRDVPWEDIFKLGASIAAAIGFRLRLMYASLIVSIRLTLSLPWFSATGAAAIVYGNLYFCMH